MNGWSLEELNQFANLTGVKLTIKGSGTVNKQSLKVGTKIKTGQKISINLKE